MINVGIIGGSGYTGELIRILMFHPNAKLDFVYSTTNAGKPLSVAHHDLIRILNEFYRYRKPECKCSFLVFGSW
jgi:N-acetyl-gamma-glutamyl-phosphate reductase